MRPTLPAALPRTKCLRTSSGVIYPRLQNVATFGSRGANPSPGGWRLRTSHPSTKQSRSQLPRSSMSSAIHLGWIPFLIASVVLVLCLGAFAQGGAGELTGLVTDTTGAVVSGVQVKLTNTATGEVRTTVTGPSGNYSLPALPIVGTYTLEVASKGF